MTHLALAVLIAGLGANGRETDRAVVSGDYLEARNADVFTGPCFSNSEIFIVGDKALIGWKVDEGSWDGVRLDGLSIVAAVRAGSTFGQDDPSGAAAVVVVDERADPAQREALLAMARHLSLGRLDRVAAVHTSMISLTVEGRHAAEAGAHHAMPRAPRAALWAPGFAEILTRPLGEGDHVCGNEVVAYAPLSEGVDAMPAYTLSNRFRGEGLRTTWSDPDARSSFVGRFSY